MKKRIVNAWKDLNRSIYTGKRLKDNMRALTIVSLFCAALGLVLVILDIVVENYIMIIPSALTLICGLASAYLVAVLKRRDIAIIIPTAFCAIAFTFYTFTGAGEGTALLWSLLMPVGICYFVSVKYGILLSIYYTILYLIVFYTPIRDSVSVYYTEAFMARFPLMYASMSIFTGIAMIQYHRSSLLEIEYTERLNAEVKKQTAVAEERAHRIQQMSYQTIQTLAYAIDAKDPYTRGHSTRVSGYSVKIAEALNWDEERVNNIRYAALLHDIGKIGVPDSILNNPKRLTDVEYDIIKSHTTMGAEILKNRVLIDNAENVALSHHERYDGTGYPNGLKGEEISEEARIVAIADAFDAMSSNRIYRKACDKEHIHRELIEGRGKQFDPKFVFVFITLWDSGQLDDIIKENMVETEESLEESSALLQEVMETFTSQSADEIDVVTGIMSRNAGETAIAQAMKEDVGCLVFFDLDNLKKINDTNGHDAGDKVLRMAGDTLSDNSDDGLCCRLGGDEFLLFIRTTSPERTAARIKKVLVEFKKKKNADPSVAVASLSAGAVMCTPDDVYEDVYNMADKALYHVKQNGKNDFAFYTEEMEGLESGRVDIKKMVSAISDSGSYEGALGVEYREFTKLYEFVGKMEKRFDHKFKLIMISLDSETDNEINDEEMERAMYYMEQSIMQTIRDVDVITRYNRHQFLVILLGTDPEGVKIATDRIFRGYYKMNGSGGFSPSYMIVDE
ncbi:MAG: diguanylate cyclase [Eubacterium sp.]|nr:diguanylate cyclase [Eubacterium sp.]